MFESDHKKELPEDPAVSQDGGAGQVSEGDPGKPLEDGSSKVLPGLGIT